MYYIVVSEEEVKGLRTALELLGRLDDDTDEGERSSSFYLYGLLKHNEGVIKASINEAVNEFAFDGQKPKIQVNAAVISIPLSGDVLYYLTGSGLILRNETFAYVLDGEIREASLRYAFAEPRVTLGVFEKLAISKDEDYLDRFIKLEATESLEENTGQGVTRTEPAEAELQEGGINPRKSSAANSEIVKIWAEEAIENWTPEELFELYTRIQEETSPNAQFVSWVGGNLSGYIIEVKNGPEAAIRFISSIYDIDRDEVAEEITSTFSKDDTLALITQVIDEKS